LLLNAQNTSSTVGFSEINGGIWVTEGRFQYRLGELPGGINGSFIYFFNADLTEIGGKLSFKPGEGLVPVRTDETWMAVFSCWQYLFTEDDPGEGPLDLMNGRPDLQGFGLFGRLAFADEDVNPWKFTGSIGVGGRGIFPGRDDDVFGIGYYYADVEADRFDIPVELDNSEHGVEVFYNMAITPAVKLTFDLQYHDSPLPTDDATLMGVRLETNF
jgi:porin